MEIAYVKNSQKGFRTLREDLESALQKRKYGILTEIDVAKVMKEKGVDFGRQILILGICNPHRAKSALSVEEDIALMFPCTVVIYESSGKSIVKLARPSVIASFFFKQELIELAKEVEAELKAAIDEVAV